MDENEVRFWRIIVIVALLICFTVFIVMFFYVVKDNDVQHRKHRAISTKSVSQENSPALENTPSENSPAPEREPIPDLIFGVESYRGDGLTFTITADDFITSYNSLYYADHRQDFILPLNEWVCFPFENSPFSPYETQYYRFQSDVRWFSEPTISLYIPADSNFVQEITFDYSMHGYTSSGNELFVQECTYALGVLFPEYEGSKITALFAELRERAEEPNAYSDSFNYRDVPPPFLFYKDNIGLFSCYEGQTLHICVLPVTQELLDGLSAKNVEIVEI